MVNSQLTLSRHVIVLALAILLGYALLLSRSEWSEMHRYNRAVGDVSLILLSMAMAIGPVLRLTNWKWVRRLLLYRRELGIWSVVAAFIHTAIILIGWVELDLWRLFGFEFHPELQQYVMVRHGFALANALGVVALLYGFVLAGTSNDLSQRVLGASVWKFLQQGAYVLWWLVIIHTGYFLFVHFLDFHRAIPAPNWAQLPFVGLVLTVILIQSAATVGTWRRQRARERVRCSSQGSCGAKQ
ncbi:ferric reductase-like transmembrane domain-containing protein [Primorskyibacter aestuariivivens]|uniref:ferric reductase-like transmembrane domain-containing protein n=1 Tax=Primorskyibacter aestuariivivens TaxID=1888912 RepID=UPI002301F0DC|nr:ferric reductase-like transmembrane domain-containing protein [Primorskyibacter aestuariivivens]MDA7429206.1 ferric reductase-like transmembrane domain-containing protein [Primorskyibacter aestuariivivens]